MSFGDSKQYVRRAIRNFTPAWHAVNMGTGAVSLLFHTFPYTTTSSVMQHFGLAFFILNVVLFFLFTFIGVVRYTIFRNIWKVMFYHPVQSLYLGTFPMGFSTLIMAAVSIAHQYFDFGNWRFIYLLWGLWWLDVAMSIVICFVQLHVMITRHGNTFKEMTTVWLLPIVTLIVTSSTGGVVAIPLVAIDPSRALFTMTVCLVLVVIGISWAFMVLTIYLQRLLLHNLPQGISIFSAFLPLGPLGQAGYAFLLIGQLAQDLFPLSNSQVILADPVSPHVIKLLCFCTSFVLWSFATAWVILAVMAILEALRKGGLSFKLPFWGMIFPNGVYANLTIQLASTLDSTIFRVWGSIYAVFTLCLWTFAAVRTVIDVWNGSIFHAPCLVEAEEMRKIQSPGDDSPETKVSVN